MKLTPKRIERILKICREAKVESISFEGFEASFRESDASSRSVRTRKPSAPPPSPPPAQFQPQFQDVEKAKAMLAEGDELGNWFSQPMPSTEEPV